MGLKTIPANMYALFEPLTGEDPQGDSISLFPAKFGIKQFSEDDIVRTQPRPSQLETTHSQLLFGQPMMIWFLWSNRVTVRRCLPLPG